MLIKDMFVKSIDRDIKGVIKVGQNEEENKKQELEEYVVTNELKGKFRDFFDSYNQSINHPTDNIGVWISGFFGSGKSHFLKILSYLLDDTEVDGKHALEYFKEDNKIDDGMTLANMERASKISSDVILFNIDAESKSKGNGESDKDPIVDVFLRVFNKMRGYYGGNPYIAEMEAQLDEDSKYEEFQEAFQRADKRGRSWKENRNKFRYVQPAIKQALVDIGYMDEQAAENLMAGMKNTFEMSAKEFAVLVQNYLKTKPANHHIIFLVDEVSQYIGNNSSLMLNLQTIVEELGTAAKGQAWVIVTGQEAIDQLTVIKGKDFSKIQGRFRTRITLNSHDVEEVIKRRILEKNERAAKSLEELYEANSSFIRNLIIFEQAAEMKLYQSGKDFATVYPFVPYQFNLLGDVLTAIRENSSSGKHLSEGERSLLASFQESAIGFMTEEEGVLIPFSAFYEPLSRFLDHGHSTVVAHAKKNSFVNPNNEENPLTLRVLKVLFMIKYVEGIKPNLNNITSMMVQDIQEDRLKLQKDVESALNILREQQYIEKNLEDYKFLTNEEQDVNREIQKQQPEFSEMTAAISNLLFNDVFPIKDRYRYPKFNGRYTIPFNEWVDEIPFKNTNFDISVHIITPNSELSGREEMLRMESAAGNVLFVDLPNNNSFIDELRLSIQIEKFVRYSNSQGSAKFNNIKANKQRELTEHRENARNFLLEALKEADLYFNGSKLPITKKDIASRMTESLESMISHVYNKLSHIDTAMEETDIRELFQPTNSLIIDESIDTVNRLAISDVREFVELRRVSASRTSLKELKEKFFSAPFGFVAKDIEWIVSYLFKEGEISLYYNQELQNSVTTPVKELIDYITSQKKSDKIQIEVRTKASPQQKRAVIEVGNELFRFSASASKDDDSLMSQFKDKASKLLAEIKGFDRTGYPGRLFVQEFSPLLAQVVSLNKADDFYKYVAEKKDDFLDMADDLDEVRAFYGNDVQLNIWKSSIKYRELYKNCAMVINDLNIDQVIEQIGKILRNVRPYDLIGMELKKLNDQFTLVYDEKIIEQRKLVKEIISSERGRVLIELETKSFKEKLLKSAIQKFADLMDRAEKQEDLALLIGIPTEASYAANQVLSEITHEEERLNRLEKEKRIGEETEKDTDEFKVREGTPPMKVTRFFRMSQLDIGQSWRLESEEDIDQQVELLRKQLLEKLDDHSIINIQF
ncbi:BREX system P-loop protein BrxC [Enterococcus sp. CWB-B31]|uniref:BREX system P-loop protein BrxC n=1 Tax=Enterococcus sp. CWB-B31 TaxID=2885159 RepID=UPI001E5DC6C9|nr:BREX system P-loop protein BrxC [Enterococcus sp. CWB-B31]MCB5955577.1 BREX system P-loop protein BrxC [Enterococcus sp. CWB-B31]